MRQFATILALVLTILPVALRAEEAPGGLTPDQRAQVFADYGIGGEAAGPDAPDAPRLGVRIYRGLAQSVRDAMAKFGPDYLDFAEDLITGYGDIDRIDAGALRAYVGFQRAGLRGSAADSLISADLDGDGRVTAREKAQAMRMLSSGLRSRLSRTHEAADTDADGTVSRAEMTAYPGAYAELRFSRADEDKVMAILAFDLNADGWVELDELRQGLAALAESGVADGGGIKLLIGG